MLTKIGLLGVGPASVRAFSTSFLTASRRADYATNLRRDWGDAYSARTIPTKLLFDSLRDLENKHYLANMKGAPLYCAAHRALMSLAPDCEVKPALTISEIENVLSDENGLAWIAIRELGDLGYCKQLAAATEEQRAAILFCRVHGIGREYAKKFAAAGIRSLSELAEASEVDGKSITASMKLGIEHLDDLEKPIPRQEIVEFEQRLGGALAHADKGLSFEIMGSYRRGEVVSSDIDVVIWHSDFKANGATTHGLMDKVVASLVDSKILDQAKILSGIGGVSGRHRGDRKRIIALTRPGGRGAPWRQMDIRLYPSDSLPYTLLSNTGDDGPMKIMRTIAKRKGLTLNEYGMGRKVDSKTNHSFATGSEIPAKSEEDIFQALGLPYLEPAQRSYSTYSHILPRHVLSLAAA
ncbi:DNA polymerase beta [Vanrija pseudolonga]|uniref:DNA polymerase n=1 Tax=Vanrija pseudolonga TaxID=143232 RepID=A0AAF0YF33_9TREE|nr:DNA polymerase beta [Vanrija pseudolonga]